MLRAFGLALSCLLLLPDSASACTGPSTTYAYCKRCTMKFERTTRRDVACQASFNVQANNFAFLGSKLQKQARNGRVSVSGATHTYTPKKGFAGTDTFTIEWALLSDNQVMVTYGEYHMTVTP